MRDRKKSLFIIRLGLMSLLMAPSFALALDSTQVLPEHINSPSLRMGMINGLGERYEGDGSLVSLTDHYAMELDSASLVAIEPRVQQLVQVLNQFGRQEMGNALTLGTLKIDTHPDVRYMAPLHAYGITGKWTVAVGVPVVQYRNQIAITQSGSNLSAIRSQTQGISPQLDSAFSELGASVASRVENELRAKGYKPLVSREETFIGDVQLASLYQFYAKDRITATSKTVLSLPTGPADDPDDLADLGIFGQTYVEETGLMNYSPRKKLTLTAKAAYRYNVESTVDKRVPTSESDNLPDASTKQSVQRKIGDSITAGGGFDYQIMKRLSAGAAYEVTMKAADQYSGGKNSNYALLAKDTKSEAHRLRLGVSYDTTTAYMNKETAIPTIISYEFSDTIRGINIERQTIHEIWLTMFF